ncbi:MAG: hypothetical protein ACLFUO_00970 [Candidatus Woesearchaeota archaeon]
MKYITIIYIILIMLSNAVFGASPVIDISPKSISSDTNEPYSMNIIASDEDSDFSTLKIYEDGNLIYTYAKDSPECSEMGCTISNTFQKKEEGEYVYEIIAEDQADNSETKEVTATIGANKPEVQFFRIGNSQAGIDSTAEVDLNSGIVFRARASYYSTLSEIDFGIAKESCPAASVCEVSKEIFFDNLGEHEISARVRSQDGKYSEFTETITLKVVCPEDTSCCDPGSTQWNTKPNDIEDGCSINGKLIEYTCSQNEIISTEVGTDHDNDGYDSECGDCDDNNRLIFPNNGNPFCDCNPEKPRQNKESICSDTFDNDCDGKVDCFDEDCPSYDPDNCRLECSENETKCPSGYCSDLVTDPNNCGECANACIPLENTIMRCNKGKCEIDRCQDGFANCDKLSDDCETNIMKSNFNCGSCGKICGTNYECISGRCEKLEGNASRNINETCVHGDSLKCVTPEGCVGERKCIQNTGIYGSCECSPYVKILSPDKDSYSQRDIIVDIDTNMMLENCTISINSPTKELILKDRFLYWFRSGENTIRTECGPYSGEKSFRVNQEPKNTSYYNIRKTLMIEPDLDDLMKIDSEFSEEKYLETKKSISIKNQYLNFEQATNISLQINVRNHLYNAKIYFVVPECAESKASEIQFKNNNYQNLDEHTIVWIFDEINSNLEIDFKVSKSLSRACIGEFIPIITAEEIGRPIGISWEILNYLLIIPAVGLITIPIISAISKRMKNDSELERIISVIEDKLRLGEDIETIRMELIQDDISKELIDRAFNKMATKSYSKENI